MSGQSRSSNAKPPVLTSKKSNVKKLTTEARMMQKETTTSTTTSSSLTPLKTERVMLPKKTSNNKGVKRKAIVEDDIEVYTETEDEETNSQSNDESESDDDSRVRCKPSSSSSSARTKGGRGGRAFTGSRPSSSKVPSKCTSLILLGLACLHSFFPSSLGLF